MSVFLTGTDTDVGKTFFAALLVRTLREAGRDAVGYKPVVSGGWDDVDALVAAADGCETRETTCAEFLEMPASPLTAAWAEQRELDPARLVAGYHALAARHEIVVVEGAGGWLVPITPRYAIADLAAELGLPVIVVVRNRLGAINHALLTLESITARGLRPLGLVLNHVNRSADPASHTNRATFSLLPAAPVIAEIEPGQRALDPAVFLNLLAGTERAGS